ncbi:hypothetical protein [Halomarina pelagica]|uniref:hypothetical protein n=1 Tax=Halomarina pelagica TaxID=2961599 RepID=UPI0020C3053E|nr:hypothetical protein [Halomarina sp. BND7]
MVATATVPEASTVGAFAEPTAASPEQVRYPSNNAVPLPDLPVTIGRSYSVVEVHDTDS